jgi:hypothetical protein
MAGGGGRLRRFFDPGVGIGCLAGFESDGIGGEGTGLQGCGEAGDEVFVGQVAAEEEDLDQGPGAVAFTVRFDGGSPPGVVHGSEPAGGPGLVKGGGAGQGTGLADQRLQVVVEFEAGSIAGDEPLVPGDLLAAVVDHELGGVEHDADGAADQPHRHRVAVHPDADLAVAVDPRCGQSTGLERLLRQWREQRLLGREVLADRARAGADAAGVVL